MKPAPPVTKAFTADHPIVSLASAEAQYLPRHHGRSFADEQAELLSLPNDDPRLVDYVTAVRRRWLTALVVMLVVVGVAAPYATAASSEHQATALIRLGAPTEASAALGAVPWLDPLDPTEEVSILTGAAVEQSVRERLGSLPDVTAGRLGDAGVLSVTVTAEEAKVAAEAANTYALTYIEERNATRRMRLETIHSALETVVAAIDRPASAGAEGVVDPETVAELRLAADLLDAAATSGQLADIEVAARQLQQAAAAGTTGDALAAVRRAQISELADMAAVGLEAIEAFGPELLDRASSEASSTEAGIDRILLAAAVAGLLLGLLAAVVRDAMDPRVRDHGDVDVGAGTAVIDLRDEALDGMGRLRNVVLLAFPDGGTVQVLPVSTADAAAVAPALRASLEGAGVTAEVREAKSPAPELTPAAAASPRGEAELRQGATGTFWLLPCAPLDSDPDGLLVAAAVDATILVVAPGRDRRDTVRLSAREVASARGETVLGVVLTDVQPD